MVALFGIQNDFRDAIQSLIKLDYAAVAAYQEAIEHLEKQEYKDKLAEFKNDHERHISELSSVFKTMGGIPPKSAGIKQLFTQGKVVFADLLGDKAILKAMKSNEDDTNQAYYNINKHPDITNEAIDALEAGLEDERKHRAWIVSALAKLEEKTEA